MAIHIGHYIEAELHRQGKTVSWLAVQLGIKRPNVYRIFQSPSCDTALLFRISCILHTDFFRPFSDCISVDTCIIIDTCL